MMFTFRIPGQPKGQGSMSLWRAPDGSTRTKYPAQTVEHRNHVIHELSRAWGDLPTLRGPVVVDVCFAMARPKAHYGTGRNSGTVKPSAPVWPVTYPDIDKAARLVCDALTIAGVIEDDVNVVSLSCLKFYDESPHTTIKVGEL